MARRGPYGVKMEIIRGSDGSQHQVYLDKSSGIFTVEIESRRIQDDSLKKLRGKAREAIKAANKLNWKLFIILERVKRQPGRTRSTCDDAENEQETEFSVSFHRLFMAEGEDGRRRFRQYKYWESHLSEAIGDPIYANYSEQYDVLIPYTEKRWETLIAIKEQVEMLQERFDGLMCSDKVEQLLEGTLRLALTDGKEPSDGQD